AAAALCATAACLLAGLLPAAADAHRGRHHQPPKPRTTQVQLLALNDLHGHLQPTTPGTLTLPPQPGGTVPGRIPAGGVAYVGAHLKQLEAQNPNYLLLGAGDMVGASPLASALFHDEPTIQALNIMGFDDSSVGNHEFDKGYRELLRLQDGGCARDEVCDPDNEFKGADFNYLAANVVKTSNGQPILPPYEIERVAGEKIGVIGVVLKDTPSIVTPAGVEGLQFLDEAQTVNKYAKVLKDKGVDATVVTIHQGGSQTGFYNDCTNLTGPIIDIVKAFDKSVDVVLSGHTHQAYNCRIAGKVVTQASSFGRVITQVKLTFDRRTKDLVGASSRNVPVTQDITPEPELQALVDKYTAASAPLANRVIGKVAGDLTRTQNAAGESTLGDVIADAQLEATEASGNAVAAFMNPGGIRADLPAGLISGGEQPGEVTYGESFTVQPFGNSLVTETLSGSQIDAVLEQQFDNPNVGENRFLQVSKGFTYTWDASKPTGSKVDIASIKINGTPIDPDGQYQITVNNFLASGGDGFTQLAAGLNPIGGGQDIDAFTSWLAGQSPLAVPALDRITRVN
ncbi:MAG TPA: bifunctional metallophosphatase/5'-nucleotidase, partial [Gaiellales bacterium]|nr:bifunctional metallophosphatase/5'-nucleotidase [Gaiellales bacterium]